MMMMMMMIMMTIIIIIITTTEGPWQLIPFLQYISFLSESNEIPPFPLLYTVTPTTAGRTSSSLLHRPVPVHSRSQFSYCTNVGYTDRT
jgi:hypothetical protein